MSGSELLSRGRELREREQFLEALNALNEALLQLQREGNTELFIHALGDRSQVWRHLFFQAGEIGFAVLARADAQSMLDISHLKHFQDKLHTAYFALGKSDLLFGDADAAVEHIEMALNHFKGPAAEKGDWICHLGEALFLQGHAKQAREKVLEGVRLIEQGKGEIGEYEYHVWLSGAYLQLAKQLKAEHPEEARQYLSKAEEIILEDDRLSLRRRQMEELKK